MGEIQRIDWSPLWLSVKTGALAAVIVLIPAIFMAEKSMKRKGRGQAIMDSILSLPLVISPAVTGFILMCILGIEVNETGVTFLAKSEWLQGWRGCLVAAAVVAFPLLYCSARTAFETINPNLLYVGSTLGMSEWLLFFKIVLPASWRTLVSGVILAFLRAAGEYGVTSLLFQNTIGKGKTLPLVIVSEMAEGKVLSAGTLSMVVIAGTLALLILGNLIKRHNRNGRRWI